MAKRFYTLLFEYEIIIMFFIVLQFFLYYISCLYYLSKVNKRGRLFHQFCGRDSFLPVR